MIRFPGVAGRLPGVVGRLPGAAGVVGLEPGATGVVGRDPGVSGRSQWSLRPQSLWKVHSAPRTWCRTGFSGKSTPWAIDLKSTSENCREVREGWFIGMIRVSTSFRVVLRSDGAAITALLHLPTPALAGSRGFSEGVSSESKTTASLSGPDG